MDQADDAYHQKQLETPLAGEVYDYLFSHDGGLHKAMSAFGQGAASQWGATNASLTDSQQKILKAVGVSPEHQEEAMKYVKAFNENFVRPVLKPFSEILGGSSQLGQQIGGQLVDKAKELQQQGSLGAIAAAPIGEAGEMLGATAAGEYIPTETALHIPEQTTGLNDLLKARSEGNLGEGEKGYFNTVPPSKENIEARSQAAATIGDPEPIITPPEPDIHTIVRQVAPDVFEDYDHLQSRVSILQTTLDNLQDSRRNDPDAQAVQQQIDTILSKVNGVEGKLTKKAAARLEEARNNLDSLLSQSSPEMEDLQRQIMLAKGNIRDLQGNVQRAYDHAQFLMPNPEQMDEIKKQHAETFTPKEEEEPTQLTDEAYSQKTQDAQSIYNDAKQKLVALGRDPEVADAEAHIVASRYMARADRLEGKAGSGLDLYNSEFPDLEAAKAGRRRGSLTIARNSKNTLRLFNSANESTFMHEMGHQWLEELHSDATRADAPDNLKADLQAVRDWVGSNPGEKFTRTQHEKFARGFERYLMEGKAPTPQLSSVFEKFKQWLINIYETVGKLRAPITDNISQVYDRLISSGEEVPLRASEKPVEGLPEEAGTQAAEKAEQPSVGSTEAPEETLGQKRPPQWRYADILKPVEGTGETKSRGSARSLESRAVEEGLTDTLGEELPKYETINLKDQADQAINLVDSDPVMARKIAMGEVSPPEGLLPEAVFKAVEHDALAKGDVQTLMNLANKSRLVAQHTLMGQRLRVLGDTGSYDFVTLAQSINNARKRAAKQFGIKINDLSPEEATKLADAVRAVEQAKNSVRIDPRYPDSNMDYGRAVIDLDDVVSELKPGNRTATQKFIDVLNIPRSALTSILHFSAPFVQGWGMISRPQAWEGFAQMFKYFASDENYRDLQAYITGHPYYDIAKKAKLGLTDISTDLNHREESIQSSLLQQANTYLKEKYGVPDLIKASSRSFTGYLNYVRFKVFTDLISAAKLAGEDISADSRVVRDIANVVNDFTGRGALGSGDRYANLQGLANAAFFSPRKQVAMFQMFNPVRYLDPRISPTARQAAIRQLSGSLIATGAVLGVAAAMGAGVDVDPRSSNFLKLQLGDEKFDFTGGVSSYGKLWGRILTDQSVSSSGHLMNLGEGYKAVTRADIIGSYVRSKLSPVASFLTDAIVGTDMIGRPFSLSEETMDKMVPITIGEIIHMIHSSPEDAAVYIPAFFTLFGIQMQSPLPAEHTLGVNVWGEPSNAFDPAPRNQIDKEASKLGVSMHLPLNVIDGIPLTNNQYKKYIVTSGQLAKQQLTPLVNSQGWQSIPDQVKAYMIKQIISGSRGAAQQYIKAESIGTNNDIMRQSLNKKIQGIR